MRLTMSERKSVIKVLAPRYQQASKKQKRKILDECCHLTGYHRCYASYLLSSHNRPHQLSPQQVVLSDATLRTARIYKRVYDAKVVRALTRLWLLMDCLCGKRLAAILGEVIPILERHGEIHLDAQTRQKLMQVSSSTIDRLLAQEKKKLALGSKAKTKPGSLLKHQIPIRTFAEWDEARPGFVEIDLVGHDGGDGSGDYLQTLDVTDVCTAWTETQAVRNKAQVWVFAALQEIQGKLPFELLGIDSDNGSEFINAHLLGYCRAQQITFTRARPWRKNDNCFVEQKNYSVVRRAVGYLRYDTEGELRLLNELYQSLRLYTNYFQPVMKLIAKERIGSKVKKRYDQPRTPFRRVLESPHVAKAKKQALKKEYAQLNPAELKREITRLQNELLALATKKEATKRKKPLEKEKGQPNLASISSQKTKRGFV